LRELNQSLQTPSTATGTEEEGEGAEGTQHQELAVLAPPSEQDGEEPAATDKHAFLHPCSSLRLSPIELRHGDLRHSDWSEADVVYVASLLFPDDLMAELVTMMTRLRPGSRILSLKEMDSPDLVLCAQSWYRMSWDQAKVYMYTRRA